MTDIEPDLTTDRTLSASLAPGPFVRWLAVGWSVARRHVLWAVVPLVSALLAVYPLARVLPDPGWPVRPRTGFPGPVVDLWTFVAAPVGDLSAVTGAPLAATMPVSAEVSGLIAGAYLGGLADLLAHRRPTIAGNVRRYGLALAAYALGWRAVEFALALALETSLPAGLAAYPVVLYLTYRVWTTPFVLVIREGGLGAALGTAWLLSGQDGVVRQFSLWLLVAVLVVSVGLSHLALGYGAVGLAVAVLLGAPVGLTLTAASLAFVRDALDRLPEDATGTSEPDDSAADQQDVEANPEG